LNRQPQHTNPDHLRREFLALQQRLQDALTAAKASATEIQALAKDRLPLSEDSLSAVCQADTLRALIDVSYGMALEIARPIHFATNAPGTPEANGDRLRNASHRRRRLPAEPSPGGPNGNGTGESAPAVE